MSSISTMPPSVGEKIKNILEMDNSNIFADQQKQMAIFVFVSVKWDSQSVPGTVKENNSIVIG